MRAPPRVHRGAIRLRRNATAIYQALVDRFGFNGGRTTRAGPTSCCSSTAYIGIANELKSALKEYTASQGRGRPTVDAHEAYSVLAEKLDALRGMLHGYDYSGLAAEWPLEPTPVDHRFTGWARCTAERAAHLQSQGHRECLVVTVAS